VCGLVGDDGIGWIVTEFAQSNGVDVSAVKSVPGGRTGAAYVFYDENGDMHGCETNGCQSELCDKDISDELISRAGILSFGSLMYFHKMDEGGLERLFTRSHAIGVTTAADTIQYLEYASGSDTLKLIEPALYETDIFIPSIDEIAWLFDGERDVWKLAKKMEPYGMKVFGVKLGAEGCFLTDFKTAYKIGACQDIVVKDTIGCGDSFFGSFLFGYSKGWTLKECGQLATVISGQVATSYSTTESVFDCDTAIRYLAEHPLKIKEHIYN
jgi:sugar/nucleoside kinase (ribokinase family)